MDWVGAQTVCDLLAIYAGIGPPACVSFVAESDGEHSDQDVRDAAARQLERTVDSTTAERVKVSSASISPMYGCSLVRLDLNTPAVLYSCQVGAAGCQCSRGGKHFQNGQSGDCPLRGLHCNMSSSTVKPEKKRVRLHSVDSLRKRCRQNWDETKFRQVGRSLFWRIDRE